MAEDTFQPPVYPVIRFIVKQGKTIAVIIFVLCALLSISAALNGAGWVWGVGGCLAGLVIAGAIASYAEVLTIISETLIPH